MIKTILAITIAVLLAGVLASQHQINSQKREITTLTQININLSHSYVELEKAADDRFEAEVVERNDWIDYATKLLAWGDRCLSDRDDPMRSFLERHKPLPPSSRSPIMTITNNQIYIFGDYPLTPRNRIF